MLNLYGPFTYFDNFFFQEPPGDSITGKQMDKFYDKGMMGTYIKLRNSAGAGKFRGTLPMQISGVSSSHFFWDAFSESILIQG